MASREPALLLIDGNSLAYRAFFALPESIATSTGEPTNALFGFASMLVKLYQDLGPVPTAVVWDAGMSGRTEVYPEYKAQRAKKPDLLRQQWPFLSEISAGFGYANVSSKGWEADDVIGTLALHARERKLRTVIVTGDRDQFQLIDPDDWVGVMATARGITETKVYDYQAVIDRYGLKPELIPDFYGLKGDTSDNIPGVPGIGDKTAAQLLQQFGDLETVLASIDQISGAKRKQNLAEHAENARISRELARIHTDVPVDYDLDALLVAKPDAHALRETFMRFELRDPWRRLEPLLESDGRPSAKAGDGPVTASVVDAPLREVALDELRGILEEADAAAPEGAAPLPVAVAVVEPVAAEQEQSGQLFDPDTTVEAPAEDADAASEGDPGQLALDVPGDAGAAPTPALPLRFAVARLDDGGRPVELLAGGCASSADVLAALEGRPLVCHDGKALAEGGDPDRGAAADRPPAPRLAHDTLLAAYVLEPQRRGYPLDELADEADVAVADTVGDLAAATAGRVALLAVHQRGLVHNAGLTELLRDVELPLVDVLREMEREGVRLSVPRLSEVRDEVHAEILELQAKIHEHAGREFTIGSPKQLGEVLFEELGLTKKRKGKTGFSTDARVLQQIRDEHEVIPLIERWRELSTLAKTYLDVLPQLAQADPRSRIHTTFQQTVAQTGRLSSTDPNLQNVPVRTALGRRIRGCFEAEEETVLLSCDYSQVELRILAFYAEEETLRDAFREDRDVHTATAMTVFGVGEDELDAGLRSKAKMVNYGIAYGLTDFGLAERLNIPREEAKEVIDAYFAQFTGVKRFIDSTIEQAKEAGEVRTMFGRRRLIPELRARNPQMRGLGERLAVNTIIQGTAADIMKLAMINVRRALDDAGVRSRMVLTIHDELLVEGPASEMEGPDGVRALVEREMVSPWTQDPPLKVEGGIGKTWVDAK
ncbi:DNA polymerase I [Patulibacter americanus]|uniref:DNA polymerase I n=1 Tax=Patulibacter americanus TaxID=588672 RepID=UPI0003B73930|nr:DNA polymerase I [Patulibacter americanus]